MASVTTSITLSNQELFDLFPKSFDVNLTTNFLQSLLSDATENVCWSLANFLQNNLNIDYIAGSVWFSMPSSQFIGTFYHKGRVTFLVDLSGDEPEIEFNIDSPGLFATLPETVTLIIPAENLEEITANAFWGNYSYVIPRIMEITKSSEHIANEICRMLRNATWENSEGILESYLSYIDDDITMEITELGAKFAVVL